MELVKREHKMTGETLYCGIHESGLKIYILPKHGFSKSYAIFGTKYGSVDSKFIIPDEDNITEVPDGIAHFLEHKMFDQPDGSNVFEQFAKFGGNANAFTSFNMTAYLFSATAHVYENLKTLLNYVQMPHFIDESVQKEQGIIAQEIRMYDDDPNWKVFFNFLECLYNNHPVKLEIAGTIESISNINSDLLYKCYNTFYNLSNMSLFVMGDVDAEETLKVIQENIIKNDPFEKEIKRVYPDEPADIAKPYAEQQLSVSIPMFIMGFKDNDIGYGGEKLLKKHIEMSILLEMLFGKGSKIYNDLYEKGLINDTFGADYTMQIDYAYTAIDGESKSPKKVYDIILSEIEELHKKGLNEDDFNRIKKVIWGNHIRSFDKVEAFSGGFLSLSFMDIDYFNYYDIYKTVDFKDITNRFSSHFDKNRVALSVMNPIG